MKSIIKILESSGVVGSLDGTTEDFCHTAQRYIEDNPSTYYSVTCTLDRRYKVNGRLLYKMDTAKQILYMQKGLIDILYGMVYIGLPEFTKKGVVHYHMLISHPEIKIPDSIVMTSILKGLQKFGKVQYVQECRNIKGYIEYMFKEYTKGYNDKVLLSNQVYKWCVAQRSEIGRGAKRDDPNFAESAEPSLSDTASSTSERRAKRGLAKTDVSILEQNIRLKIL